ENNYQQRTHVLVPVLRNLLFDETAWRGRNFTFFGSKPYLRYLTLKHKVTGVRHEHMKESRAAVMGNLARWLGIPWNETLMRSTWDGKIAWNRPESRSEEGAPQSSAQSDFDHFRLRMLCRSRARAVGYRSAPATFVSRLLLAPLLLLPWRASVRNRFLRRRDV